MKFSNVSKLIGAGVLAASVAVVPFTLPASAQTNTAPDNTTTTNGTNQGVSDAGYNKDNDFDWGWLGLLGLAGLAGLAGRKRNDDVRYRTNADEVGSTTYRR